MEVLQTLPKSVKVGWVRVPSSPPYLPLQGSLLWVLPHGGSSLCGRQGPVCSALTGSWAKGQGLTFVGPQGSCQGLGTWGRDRLTPAACVYAGPCVGPTGTGPRG